MAGDHYTAEEIERRAEALKQTDAFRDGIKQCSTSNDDFVLRVILWQAALARETIEDRGIDALYRILCAIITQYSNDETRLLFAIDEMRDCADRHLLTKHETQTIHAIFRAAFAEIQHDWSSAFTRAAPRTRRRALTTHVSLSSGFVAANAITFWLS